MGWNITRFPDKDQIEREGDLICSICTNVLEDPVQTPCSHVFCRKCIQKWLDTGSNNCPIDRELLTLDLLKPESRITMRRLNRYSIRCKNYSTGCRLMSFLEDMPKLMEHEANDCNVAEYIEGIMKEMYDAQEEEYERRILDLEDVVRSKDRAIVKLENSLEQLRKINSHENVGAGSPTKEMAEAQGLYIKSGINFSFRMIFNQTNSSLYF